MDVVVVGGGGLTGRCCVRDLAESRVFDHIRVADLDGDLARKASERAGGEPRVRWEVIDVRDPRAMSHLLEGARVCVNAVQYRFNLEIMEACLASGVDYLDFGGLYHMTRRQLAWDDRFRDGGRLAVPGFGQVPGISNVLARAATDDMVAVDSIIIRDGWRDLTVGGPDFVFTWSPSTFLDEMMMPAIAWIDGAYREFPPMSEPETFEFPAPIGTIPLYRTLHSEPATLPSSLAPLAPRNVEWREGGSGIDVLRLLAQLGLGGEEPITVDGAPVVPRRVLLELLRSRKLLGYPEGVQVDDVEVTDVEVRGRTSAGPLVRHATAAFHSKPEWGAAATEYAVGIAGSIGAILIAQGAVHGVGVVPPERAIPAGPMRSLLRDRGVVTRISPPEAPLTSLDRASK
ncbi:MAG: saccharopine dehydrogenase NADP-binding domain-containing protein [Thermoplasmata archaeon]|nr:saccharopine dehydrogenase NADP-binding domain-containing protein [Thermoplasmata archaeon]